MKKTLIIVLIFTLCNVNAQELKKNSRFTPISEPNSRITVTDPLLFSTNTYKSIETKKINFSINCIEEKRSPNQQLLNVKVNYYQVVDKLIIIPPDWGNINALGFRIAYQIQ